MDLYLEKEERLKYIGFNDDDSYFTFRYFDKKGSFIDYFVSLVKYDESVFKFNVYDVSKNLLFSQDTDKYIEKTRIRSVRVDVEKCICKYLNIDFFKYKYLLFHSFTKDELYHFMMHYEVDERIFIPISYLYTPHSNWSHADIFHGFINCYKNSGCDDDMSMFDNMIEYLFYDDNPNKISVSAITDFLYKFTSDFYVNLSVDDREKFNINEKFFNSNKHFHKTLRDTYNIVDFEYKPIFENVEDTSNLSDCDIDDSEPISYEYKFIVRSIPQKPSAPLSDVELVAGSVLGSTVSLFALKSILNIIKDKK